MCLLLTFSKEEKDSFQRFLTKVITKERITKHVYYMRISKYEVFSYFSTLLYFKYQIMARTNEVFCHQHPYLLPWSFPNGSTDDSWNGALSSLNLCMTMKLEKSKTWLVVSAKSYNSVFNYRRVDLSFTSNELPLKLFLLLVL